jgi:hypothetical protein
MKSFIYLTSIATTAISLFMPGSVVAQSIFGQNFSSNGYASTTIYIPSTQTTITTTIGSINSNIYPASSSVTTSTITNYSPGAAPLRHRHQHRQPTAIFQPPTIYPHPIRSHCTTSIIGSPIPSPVPIDSVTGQLCN